MRILIAVDVYPPEISSASHLMQELAEGLVRRGHAVSVLTTYPRHYLTHEAKEQSLPIVATENGVRVVRVKTLPLKKVPFMFRGISQLLLPFFLVRGFKQHAEGAFDAVIVYSPPLPMYRVGLWAKRAYGARFLLNIQDIFPQNAIDLGILKNSLLVRFFELMEQRAYCAADGITFHSAGGRRFLIEKKHVPEEKIATVHNWVDLDEYRNIAHPISFRERYQLKDKFIFLFAGIMGPAQGLEFLLDVAERVQDIHDVVFLLVGDGSEKEKLVEQIENRKIRNVRVEPFVSKHEYPSLVRDSDVGIVCLSPKNKTPFVPGKFLGYLAAGKPVLAFLNAESDGFDLVERARCGHAVQAGDVDGAVAAIRALHGDRAILKKLGEQGLHFAQTNISLDVCLGEIEKLLRERDLHK